MPGQSIEKSHQRFEPLVAFQLEGMVHPTNPQNPSPYAS